MWSAEHVQKVMKYLETVTTDALATHLQDSSEHTTAQGATTANGVDAGAGSESGADQVPIARTIALAQREEAKRVKERACQFWRGFRDHQVCKSHKV